MTETTDPGTALAIQPQTMAVAARAAGALEEHAFEPRNIAEAFELAKYVHASGMFETKSPQQAFVIFGQGRELGLSVFQSLAMIDVVEGRPSLKAMAQVALCESKGIEIWCSHNPTRREVDDKTFAEWSATKKGKTVTATFTAAEAARIRLGTGKDAKRLSEKFNWVNQPEQMLVWRAATRLIREHFAFVTLGLMDPDEAEQAAATGPAPRVASIEIDEAPAKTKTEELKRKLGGAPKKPTPVPDPEPKANSPEDVGYATQDPELVARQATLDELRGIQQMLIDTYGEDAARRAFTSRDGPGSLRGQSNAGLDTLKVKLEKAHDIAERLMLGASVNDLRLDVRELTGEDRVPLKQPELLAVEELKGLLDAERNRVSKAKAE